MTVTLAELCVFACAEAFRDDEERIANGIGPIPRLAASLAKMTHSPGLLMTDSEARLVEQPIPLGPRNGYEPKYSGYLPFSQFFDAAVWNGKRHAMVTPVQLDRFGQKNLSYLGGTHEKPKVQLLGVRGFPGNAIYHRNSMFIPSHTTRVFVPEVDMISSPGYNPAKRIEGGNYSGIDLHRIVTNLCVMDFGGPDNQIRVLSLHPGVTFEEVQEATGFELAKADNITETPLPGAEELEIIRKLDPTNIRATVIKDNPPAARG